MALKTLIQFPIFAPSNPTHDRPATGVRFSRWNNANAEKFIRHERTQKEIEDELRLVKRFNSAQKIVHIHDKGTSNPAIGTNAGDTFRSTGTPSSPSRPSIPGKASKYSKSPERNPRRSHPAFRRFTKVVNIPSEIEEAETGLKVSDDGVSYVLADAPFEFQYSYTETPKVKPLKLREPPIAPFGPSTMPRPWTGRKPLEPSKKKLEFDSFKLPPPHKKGVKPVQAPGPFLPGSGPRYVQSREEILGESLTKEEIEELVKSCMKSKRQLNMGRDGLTHNMLDNIHAHWKRRRVCKIKCKGVCTVDMDNVRQQLEEKTGGKIIHSKGGVIYLFRGRNYNYKTRPRFPLMLWKPVTPVYPRLIQRVPEGLTLEEASEMRKRGRNLTPICKLGKNGFYCDLAKNVREAFEACELVRINCQGMKPSDYHKIGAKLKDLVPCVLISFEREHILMWRGRNWKSSLTKWEPDFGAENSEGDGAISTSANLEIEVATSSSVPGSEACTNLSLLGTNTSSMLSNSVGVLERKHASTEVEDHLTISNDRSSPVSESVPDTSNGYRSETLSTSDGHDNDNSEYLAENHESKITLYDRNSDNDETIDMSVGSDTNLEDISSTNNRLSLSSVVGSAHNELQCTSEMSQNLQTSICTEGVILLWKEAIESGAAVVLDEASLDCDVVYRTAVDLALSAPPGPVFRYRHRKVAIQNSEEQKAEDSEVEEVKLISRKGEGERKGSTNKRRKERKEDYLSVVPQGSLRVDELAKLLA
ncbi:hypothetical protein NMG60_11013451 [Bertholletia excelsa]